MKKLLLTFFVLGFSLSIVEAQSKWSPRTSIPDSARGEGIAFSIGNYGYIGLGENYYEHPLKFYNDFWQFNPATNLWIKKANFPGKARVWPATFVIGRYAYVVTGRDSGLTNYLTECWQYNSVTDHWTQKASFPGLARAYAVGFAIGGNGYVGLGHNADFYKDFWVYDTATNSWAAIVNFGGMARWCASAFSVGGKGYVCFGQDSIIGNSFTKDIWVYDTSTNIWTQKSNYPGFPIFCTSGFVIQNSIFVGTGQDSTGALSNKFWQYNTLNDSWTSVANLPSYSKAVCSAFSIIDTGYLGLGEDSTGAYYNTLYRFLPDSTTGILELISKTNGVLIYPNPNSGKFNIAVSIKRQGISDIQIYNMLGTRVFTKTLDSTENINSISLSGQPSGIYFYRLISESGLLITNGKFVIE